jgi:predicted RNase H-like nuclease
VLLVGLDAASRHSKFGFPLGHYDNGRVQIESAGLLEEKGCADALTARIAPRIRESERALIAIDAPLGWPLSLGRELPGHSAGQAFKADKDLLFNRETDRFVRKLLGKRTLEVAADKIARAAHTALQILATLRVTTGREIPLAWNPEFSGTAAIEVYPAGTLIARGVPSTGYKEVKDKVRRMAIATGLKNEIPDLSGYVDGSTDVFDACLCLLAGMDFLEEKSKPLTNHAFKRI